MGCRSVILAVAASLISRAGIAADAAPDFAPGPEAPAFVHAFVKRSNERRPLLLERYQRQLNIAEANAAAAKRGVINKRAKATQRGGESDRPRFVFPSGDEKKATTLKWTNYVEDLRPKVEGLKSGVAWPIPFLDLGAHGEIESPLKMQIGLVGALYDPVVVRIGDDRTFYASHPRIARTLVIRGVDTEKVGDDERVQFSASRLFLVVGTETVKTYLQEKRILWQVETLPGDDIFKHLPAGSFFVGNPEPFQ